MRGWEGGKTSRTQRCVQNTRLPRRLPSPTLVYTLPSFTLVLVTPRLHCPRLHPSSRLHSLPLPLVYTLSRLHPALVYTRYQLPSFTLPLVYTALVYTLPSFTPFWELRFYRDRCYLDNCLSR